MPKKKNQKNKKKITYIAFMILYVLCIFFSGYNIYYIFSRCRVRIQYINYYYMCIILYIHSLKILNVGFLLHLYYILLYWYVNYFVQT